MSPPTPASLPTTPSRSSAAIRASSPYEGESGVEPAIVIERYDRLGEGGNVTRLHQEDLCQALGCLPDCTDKMNIGDIERAIGASYELRNKKDLIEAFIDSLDSSNAARRPSRN